jgi:hypothetical protein
LIVRLTFQGRALGDKFLRTFCTWWESIPPIQAPARVQSHESPIPKGEVTLDRP